MKSKKVEKLTVRPGGQKTEGLARTNPLPAELAGLPLFESVEVKKKKEKVEKKEEKKEEVKTEEKKEDVAAEQQFARPRVKANANAQEKEEFRNYLRETKGIAKGMEKNNFTKIILFDSGSPWYKIAFNSLLIYEYRVMPHLKEARFTLRPDSDSYHRSDGGIVGVNDLVAFADIMRKVGASLPEELESCFDGDKVVKRKLNNSERRRFYVFELGEMTREKFNTYLKARKRKAEDLNELVLPAYIPRELYPDAHGLAQEIAKMTARFPKEIRDTYGEQVAKLSVAIVRDINIACNGYYGGKKGFMDTLERVLYRAAEIQEILRILMDANLISYGLCQMLTLASIKVQKDALAEYAALLSGDSKFVQAIKDAKNFPRIMNIDLSDQDTLPKKDPKSDKNKPNGYIETIPPEE